MKSSTGLIRSELLPAHLRRPGQLRSRLGRLRKLRPRPAEWRDVSEDVSEAVSEASSTISCCSEWRNQRRFFGTKMVLLSHRRTGPFSRGTPGHLYIRTPGRVLVLQLTVVKLLMLRLET